MNEKIKREEIILADLEEKIKKEQSHLDKIITRWRNGEQKLKEQKEQIEEKKQEFKELEKCYKTLMMQYNKMKEKYDK